MAGGLRLLFELRSGCHRLKNVIFNHEQASLAII
jgi:hypothetical protein